MEKPNGLKNKYDIHEVAKRLGLSYLSTCKLCREGKIRSMKVGQKIYIAKRDFDIYLNEGNIFDKPEKVILDTIKQAIAEAMEENIKRIELAVKQKIITELEGNIKINKKNKEFKRVLPQEAVKNLRYRETKPKKEFQKVK